MGQARLAIACLWLAHTLQAAVAQLARVVVLAALCSHATAEADWYLVLGLWFAPAVLLAPLAGAVTNTVPKPLVLIGAAALGFGAASAALFALLGNPFTDWLTMSAMLALAGVFFVPASGALLPAAADDLRCPLSSLNGLFVLGTALALLASLVDPVRNAGIWLGVYLLHPGSGWLIQAAVAANLLLVLSAQVRFVNDARRPAALPKALLSFFADAHTILADREACVCLLGMALLRGTFAGVLLPLVVTDEPASARTLLNLCTTLAWLPLGLALGAVLAGLQRHPRRVLGFVPWGALGLTAALVWAAICGAQDATFLCAVGLAAGLIQVPLAATYQASLPADSRGNGMALSQAANSAAVLLLLMLWLSPLAAVYMTLVAVGTGVACCFAAWIFRREALEVVIEAVFLIMYRFESAGPGLTAFPRKGPVLVIANHSSWLDPPYLSKVLPRPMIALMTSVFFDVPVLRWLMVHFAQAIRVQAATFRREVPELGEAIAALDRGACVLIFPEGAMRRTDDKPLRMFGQGVWHILRERPMTPVVLCWIEGGWGSFFSYRGGLPTKNKRFDLFRKIRVAVGMPHVIAADVLADQRRTRQELMRECLDTRRYLGLAPSAVPIDDAAE